MQLCDFPPKIVYKWSTNTLYILCTYLFVQNCMALTCICQPSCLVTRKLPVTRDALHYGYDVITCDLDLDLQSSWSHDLCLAEFGQFGAGFVSAAVSFVIFGIE